MSEKKIKLTLNEMELKLIIDYIAAYEMLVHRSPARTSKIKKKLETALNKKPMKISSRKAKGRSLQYWVCNRIAEMLGIEFVQKDDTCLIHSREMGQSGTDIALRGEAAKMFPFDVECKNTEGVSFNAFIQQAKANEKPERSWLLVIKNSIIEKPVAVMDWETFEKIFRKGNPKIVGKAVMTLDGAEIGKCYIHEGGLVTIPEPKKYDSEAKKEAIDALVKKARKRRMGVLEP